MTYTFRPQGVCSREMRVELDDQGVIQKMEALGGCSGNLQGISALVVGMTAEEAVHRLKGIRCGAKSTSCPDQLAYGLAAWLNQQKQRPLVRRTANAVRRSFVSKSFRNASAAGRGTENPWTSRKKHGTLINRRQPGKAAAKPKKDGSDVYEDRFGHRPV